MFFAGQFASIVDKQARQKHSFVFIGKDKGKNVDIQYAGKNGSTVYLDELSKVKKKSATATYMKTKEFKNWAKKNKIKY